MAARERRRNQPAEHDGKAEQRAGAVDQRPQRHAASVQRPERHGGAEREGESDRPFRQHAQRDERPERIVRRGASAGGHPEQAREQEEGGGVERGEDHVHSPHQRHASRERSGREQRRGQPPGRRPEPEPGREHGQQQQSCQRCEQGRQHRGERPRAAERARCRLRPEVQWRLVGVRLAVEEGNEHLPGGEHLSRHLGVPRLVRVPQVAHRHRQSRAREECADGGEQPASRPDQSPLPTQYNGL